MARKAKPKPARIPKKNGRPALFTPELGKRICDLIAEGKSLRQIAAVKGIPSIPCILSWLLKAEAGDNTYKDFFNQYTHARDIQTEFYVDQMIEISDNQTGRFVGKKYIPRDAQWAKLQIDTRKWHASKLRPKKYGEKYTAELTGKDGAPLVEPLSATDFARRMAFIFAEAEKENQTKGKPNANNKQK